MSNKTENLTVPQSDYGYNLDFTLKDSDDNARGMIGYNLPVFKVWRPGVPGTLLVSGTCAWTAIALGTCYYKVVLNDFDIVERYLYEIEVTQAGVIESAQNGWLTVAESG